MCEYWETVDCRSVDSGELHGEWRLLEFTGEMNVKGVIGG